MLNIIFIFGIIKNILKRKKNIYISKVFKKSKKKVIRRLFVVNFDFRHFKKRKKLVIIIIIIRFILYIEFLLI